MGEHESLVNQGSWRPTAKVLATWCTGAGSTVVLAVLALATDGVDPSTVYGGAIVAAAVAVAGWVKRNRTTDV